MLCGKKRNTKSQKFGPLNHKDQNLDDMSSVLSMWWDPNHTDIYADSANLHSGVNHGRTTIVAKQRVLAAGDLYHTNLDTIQEGLGNISCFKADLNEETTKSSMDFSYYSPIKLATRREEKFNGCFDEERKCKSIDKLLPNTSTVIDKNISIVNNCQQPIGKPLICNPISPSYCENNISADKSNKNVILNYSVIKSTRSESDLITTKKCIISGKDKFEQDSISDIITDNELGDYKEKGLVQHKRKIGLTLLSSKKSVPICNGNIHNPISNCYKSIKVAVSPQLDRRPKPLKAIHGICQKNILGEYSRSEICTDKLDNITCDNELNKCDTFEPRKVKITDGQLNQYNGDSSITYGTIDSPVGQHCSTLDTSLVTLLHDQDVKLLNQKPPCSVTKLKTCNDISKQCLPQGQLKSRILNQDEGKNDFNSFLKSAFDRNNNIQNSSTENTQLPRQPNENNNLVVKTPERKAINVNKTSLHCRLKAFFNKNTSEKVQGDLNSSVISSASSTFLKRNNESEGCETNQVNECLLDTLQISGHSLESCACNEKCISIKLSHTENKAGDNSEQFQTKESSLSDETNIALGCVNKGLLNQTSYTQLQSNEDRYPTDFGKKHDINSVTTGESVLKINYTEHLESKLNGSHFVKAKSIESCQETRIERNVKDCYHDKFDVNEEVTQNTQDIVNGNGQFPLENNVKSQKTLDNISSNDSQALNENIDQINGTVCTLSESIVSGKYTCGNLLTLVEPSEKDKPPNNEEFIASQKKKIALYRGKFSVNADHHSAVSSNLSLSSSKGSSKKLNVGNIEQMLKMDRPTSRLGNLRLSNNSILKDNPSKFFANKMHTSHAYMNRKLETSYTSQDSGYVPGYGKSKNGAHFSLQPTEISSQISENSSSLSKAYEDPQKVSYIQHQRLGGSGQSDTSYSVEADNPPSQNISGYKRQSRSKSYTDINRKSKNRKLRKPTERSRSHHDVCDSVDTLSHDNTVDSSLDNSAHSSLYLMNAPRVHSRTDKSSSPMLAICDKQNFRHSSYIVECDLVFPKEPELEHRRKSGKKYKNREWGTVGNIPRTVKRDKMKDDFLRTVSFDNGVEEMHRHHRSYEMIDRIESESEDSDSSIDIENIDDFSMADDTSHVGGSSLDDKLRLAASKGQVERIPTLLAQGAGFLPDKEGRTAIHYAALSGYSEAVRILAANGCDVNTQDNLGYTALHRAAAQGHLEVVRVLCDCSCNLNIQDDVHGNSALHEAAWNGYSRTVELLCQYKASVQLVNKAGFSALHLAAQNGHNQSGRALLYANCDPSHKNNYGDTPLHTAGRYGHAGVTRILLSAKCRISEQNKNGDSALHISAALKRRKIAKLLVENNINISLKNKQNETAADVSRRKDHPEILLIITSQPKLHKQKKKEDKKKKKEGKVSGIEESDDPRKDKKMFFFRKRSKSKDKENKENREASTDRLDSRPFTAPSSIEGQPGLACDAHSHSSGGDSKGLKARTNSKERIAKSQGTTTRPTSADRHHKKVHGLLTQYEAKTGVQYYRDLAGNIKQGPIGFAPVCNCGPHIKKIEQRMEADKNNMYDHIDATHKMLSHKMDDMDHKCSQRVHSADRVNHQQFQEHKHAQDRMVNTRILQERQETDKMMQFQEHLMRSEYMDYVGRKVGAFEEHYAPMPSRCKGCDHCGPSNPHPHYRDDHDLNPPPSMPYSVYQQGTGLYRSKSDETLSISSSHPSKRHWKMKSKSRSIRELKDKHFRTEGMQAEMIENELKAHGTRPPPQGQGGGGVVGNVKQENYQFEDIYSKKQLSSGRSPEGQSSNNEYSEQSSYLDPVSHYGTWNRNRKPINSDLMQQISDKDTMQQDFEKLTVRDYPQSSLSNGQSTSTPVSQLPRPQSGSQLSSNQPPPPPQNSAQSTPEVHTNYSAPYNTPAYNTPNYNTPNSSYNTHNNSSKLTSGSSYVLSPEQVQVHHTKTDSGSNPDSGYSSKIYGIRPTVSGRSIGTSQGSPDNMIINAQHHHQIQPQSSASLTSQYPQMRVGAAPQLQQPQYPQQQYQRSEVSPTKALHRNRGYSSDGCPGMRRPKQDAYASDNSSGMRMKKPAGTFKSGLNDWYEKQVSGKGNGVISEVPAHHGSQQQVNGAGYPPNKPRDFWPGKATQV